MLTIDTNGYTTSGFENVSTSGHATQGKHGGNVQKSTAAQEAASIIQQPGTITIREELHGDRAGDTGSSVGCQTLPSLPLRP